jgi:hypothetical protein
VNEALYNVLTDRATAGPDSLVTYAESAAVLGLNLENPGHRTELARLLGEISTHEVQQQRPMLTSIVVHSGGDQLPGIGFYELGRQLGVVRPGEDQDMFAIRQMKATWQWWSNPPSRRS